ncbi:hypothetical protein BASA83_012819 [Batrachochytrium salamandrivorans]|nr:hypothetical protein BASA83_012819 [Batrachochytrium salamandrivorans]
MLVSSVIALLTIGSTSVLAVNYAKFNLLKDDRDAGRFVFIPTTLEQKEVILSNVENALICDVYCQTPRYPCPFGEDYSKIQAGDELLAINGLSFVEWFEKNKFISGAGANDFGGYRAALKYLTTIYGAINRLPSDDFINFQFKSHANPEIIYTVNVPYVSGRNEKCWKLGSKLYKSITGTTLLGTPATGLLVNAEQSGHNHKSDTAHLPSESRNG